MGMWSFLRTVLRKKPRPPLLVASSELPSWFDAQRKERIAQLDGALQGFSQAVRRIYQQLREQREQLLLAQMKDDAVEQRIKNVVMGHRDNYARELVLFLNDIAIPAETNLDSSILLANELRTKLDTLAQRTAKSFQATRHLFHQQADLIAGSLRELSTTLTAFAQFLEKRNIPALQALHGEIAALRQQEERQQRVLEELAAARHRLAYARRQLEAKESSIEDLRAGEEFASYQDLLATRDKLVDQSAATERSVLTFFLEIDRALRKYEYLAADGEQALVRSYLQNAPAALLADQALAIIGTLRSLSGRLTELGLKEETVKKLEDFFSMADLQQLAALRAQEQLLISERHALLERMEAHPVMGKLRELEYKRDHFRQQLERLTGEEAALSAELQRSELDGQYRRLGDQIGNVLQTSVTITRAS